MPTISVAAGCVSAPLAVAARSIVTVSPAAGATAMLEYTAGSASGVANGVAQWSSWPKGASTSPQQDIINEPAFLRLTATGGSATLNTEESPTILAREDFNSDWGGSKRYPFILAQSGSPIILLPAGLWNNTTGQMAVGTPMTYPLPTGPVLVYLFASGIAQAGLYQAVFSGIAASPVVQIVGNPTTVAGAYTPTISTKVALASVVVPGGAVGNNGSLRYSAMFSSNNTPGAKYGEFMLGGVGVSGTTANMASAPAMNIDRILRADNGQAAVKWAGSSAGLTSSGTGSYVRNPLNIAVDQVMTINATVAVATDWMILEGYTIEVLPA